MKQYWLFKSEFKDFLSRFPNVDYSVEFDQSNYRVPSEELENIFEFLKKHKAYPMDMLVDITAVDYLSSDYAEKPNYTGREEDLYSESRYDVVYHFYSTSKNKRIRIITTCGGEAPQLSSSYSWWQAAHFLEREVYDMFGIRFTGHPDLRRVLLYEEFEGHPLRKDYPVAGEQPRTTLRNPEQDNG